MVFRNMEGPTYGFVTHHAKTLQYAITLERFYSGHSSGLINVYFNKSLFLLETFKHSLQDKFIMILKGFQGQTILIVRGGKGVSKN